MLLETLYGLIGQHPELSGLRFVVQKGDIRWNSLLWRRVTVMHETPLASLITTKFAIPCSVINDGKAALLNTQKAI
jgi:hypothetical protein